MNEKLQNTINSALKDLVDTASQVKQFAVDQIPELLQQLLMFKLAQDIFLIIISVMVIIVSWLLFSKWSNQNRSSFGEYSESKIISSVIGGISSIVAFIAIIYHTIDALKIIIAPKLYLLEYAASLVK